MIDRFSGAARDATVINNHGSTPAKITGEMNPSVLLGQLVLPLRRESARHARVFIATSLEAWFENRAGEIVHDSQTVVTELVANAGAPRGALSYPRRSREELEGGFWV